MINIDVVNPLWPRNVEIDTDEFIENQAPPGPPPRAGLRWKPQTRRWIRPKTSPKIDPDEYVSPFRNLESRVRKNDLYKAWGELFKSKIDDDSSPEYEQFLEVFSWLMGFSGPSSRSAVRIKMLKGDPSGSYVFQDYRNAVAMALVGARYPHNNNAPIPKRHVRKIIDITLSTETKEMEKNAVSLGGESQQIAGRMTKPYTRYRAYSERAGRDAKLTGAKMELFDVENRSQQSPYDFAQTVVHEMAHGVYFDLPFWYRVRVEHLYIKAVQENKGLPSQYAKENENEFFSECYTAYVTDTDAFRERNPNMASELDMLFSKILKDKFPSRRDRDEISDLIMELQSGIFGEHKDGLLKEFEGDLRTRFPYSAWSDEMIANLYGLTLEEYEMHQWNRDNWPTESSKGDTIKEEQLVFMVEKTLVSEDPIVIEDPADAIGFTEDLPNADPIDMPAISEDSFADDDEEETLELQAPPGPPPRHGLVWKPQTHRWIRPEEFNVPVQQAHQLDEPQRNQIQRSLDDIQNEGRYGTVKKRVDDEMSYVAMGYGFVERQSPIQEEVEILKEKTTRAIQTLIHSPETAVWTRVPEASLRKILGEGIFRTSHETGKTAPGKPAATGSGKLQGYLDLRKRIETSNFGEDANPIYAYLSDHEEGKLRERKVYKSKTATSSPKDHYEDVAVMYGNMRIRLKPHVKQKTTVTGGDSYDNVGSLYHQFMADIDYRMLPELFSHLAKTQVMSEDFHKGFKSGMEAHFPRTPEQREALRKGIIEFESRIESGDIKLKDLTYNYIEAQIHGGLSVDDIEEIVIDYKWNKSANQLDIDEDGNPKVSSQLLKRLDDLGIHWRFGSMPSAETLYKMLMGEIWNR